MRFEISVLSSDAADDTIILTIKNFFKRYFPGVFSLLYNSVAIYVSKGPRPLIRNLPSDALILSVGSGVFRIDERVVNIDISPQSNVDIVASAYALPFLDNSVDMIISESLFEHLERPNDVVREFHRVLKPGGVAYIVTPFMLGFHSSPNDFYRWTLPGMKLLLDGFEVTESGIAVGPTGAFVAITREWLAILLSFGSRMLYQFWILFFMIALIPLNIFDYLVSRYSYAAQIAMSYYWVARKK